MPGQVTGHHREDVVVHPGPLQQPGRPDHPVIGALPRPVPAEPVVALPVSVQREAHQEALLLKQAAPLLVQPHPVGLDSILHRQPRGERLPHIGGEVPVELQPRQGGLPALEEERDRALRRLCRLLDQGMAHRLRHPAVIGNRAGLCLVGIKAIRAAQIASAGSGL